MLLSYIKVPLMNSAHFLFYRVSKVSFSPCYFPSPSGVWKQHVLILKLKTVQLVLYTLKKVLVSCALFPILLSKRNNILGF